MEDGSENRRQAVGRDGWINLGLGLVAALAVAAWWPFGVRVASYLLILIHEIGHSACHLAFGYPSLPAFDFQYGGGWAIHQERHSLLFAMAIGLALAPLALGVWRRKLLLAVYLPALGLYFWLAWSRWHEALAIFMGHGNELVFAGIFLYRAISGAAVQRLVERPLYAALGWFFVLHNARFAWLLLTDKVERTMYEFGKGGHAHDFVLLAEDYLRCDLTVVAGFFLACCLLPPVAAFLLHRRICGSSGETF